MKYLVPLDLSQNELQNARIQNLAAAPSSPVEGQIYYNSSAGNKKGYIWNGTAWVPWEANTDTKNTAGSTDTSSKIFIIGATSQADNPQTYSQDTAYVGTDGHLYSNSKQVVNLSDSQALTNKTYNGYTLAAASAKGVDTSISSGSSSTNLPTTAAVASFVSTEIGAVDAMRFKGTVGTGGTVTDLPTTDVKTGDTYRVITAGTYAGVTCEVGDLIIATSTTPTWTVAQTNIDGAVTASTTTTNGYLAKFTGDKVVANGPQLGSGTTTFLRNDGTWASPYRTYTSTTGKPTGDLTPGFGDSITISQINQSLTGQITATDRTITIPNTTATTSIAGLMSAADKTKLDGIGGDAYLKYGEVTLSGSSATTDNLQGEWFPLCAFIFKTTSSSSSTIYSPCVVDMSATFNENTHYTSFTFTTSDASHTGWKVRYLAVRRSL